MMLLSMEQSPLYFCLCSLQVTLFRNTLVNKGDCVKKMKKLLQFECEPDPTCAPYSVERKMLSHPLIASGADKRRYGDKLQENVRKFASRILEILTENKVKVGPSGSFKIKPRGTKETTLELSPGLLTSMCEHQVSV